MDRQSKLQELARSDFEYWTDKASRLEQEARQCRIRAQAAKDSADGQPGRTAINQNEAA